MKTQSIISILILGSITISLASSATFAATESAVIDTKLDAPAIDNANRGRWNIEGNLQAHSIAGPSSPLIGLAAAYRIFEPFNLGIRGYLPLESTVDKATYSLEAFGRIRVGHGLSTDFFLEPSYAQNFYDLILFNSYGFAAGAMTHITPGFSLGVEGGIETAKVVLDSSGLEKEDSYVIYPKVAFLANFNF